MVLLHFTTALGGSGQHDRSLLSHPSPRTAVVPPVAPPGPVVAPGAGLQRAGPAARRGACRGKGRAGPGGGVAGWAVFTSNAFVILGVRPRLWGRGFPPPSRTAGRPSPGRAAPPFGSSQLMQTPIGSPGNPPAHSDPHCQPRSRPQPTQTSIAKLRAPL